MADLPFPNSPPAQDGAEEVASDAVQLFTVATFNGLCRLISALAENGLLNPDQIENIHDAMTTPLDDPEWQDDDFVSGSRETVHTVLAQAMKHASEHWEQQNDDGD